MGEDSLTERFGFCQVTKRKSDLPFGSEFSPSQIDLVHVLELAALHGGDWRAFEEAVRSTWFDGHSTSDYNRGKLANNTKLAMRAYGIIEKDASLTDFGSSPLPDEGRRTRALSVSCSPHPAPSKGMTLVGCIQDMEAAGETVNLTTPA